jgi:hypothetical protein
MKAQVKRNVIGKYYIDTNPFRQKTAEELDIEKYGMPKEKFIQALK